MFLSQIKEYDITNQMIDSVLFSNNKDTLDNGNIIFVFGSVSGAKYRVPKAVELYKQGRCKKILFSGGTIWSDSTSNNKTEAEFMKDCAVQMGVNENDIYTENLSLNTKENVIASALVLDRMIGLHKLQTVLVVTTEYHMTRCLLTLKTYLPNWINFIPCYSQDNNTRRDTWFLNEKGKNRVYNEVKNLIQYINEGQIQDLYIPNNQLNYKK